MHLKNLHCSLFISVPLLVMISACSQPQVASLVDKRDSFFGRNSWFSGGQAVPRYSDSNRANQDGDVAYKYHSRVQTYGVDAAVDNVAVNELAPPAPVTVSENAPIAAKPAASSSMISNTPVSKPAVKNTIPVNGANLAFVWPVQGKIISRFGPKTDGLSNDGINIAAHAGDPIYATASGEVVYMGSGLESYGNLMILRHSGGWMTSYGHANEFLLKKGDKVAQGDVIGYVGNSGSVKTPQLHFSMREGKIPVDPESVLAPPSKVAALK
jgi:murein DD-endopeptidase MepM/ murein hydrolase activator NlpD